jgi:hypothetical protein
MIIPARRGEQRPDRAKRRPLAWPIDAVAPLPGVSLLAAGIPLTVLGGIGFARWRRWQARYGLTVQPMIGRSASGAWLPGLAIRF